MMEEDNSTVAVSEKARQTGDANLNIEAKRRTDLFSAFQEADEPNFFWKYDNKQPRHWETKSLNVDFCF